MASNDIVSAAQPARVTRTVLMVDMKDSVRLMEEDEIDTVQRWLRLVKHVENSVLPVHGGRLVKSQGDGMLLEFQSVRPALQAAFVMQQAAAEANAGVAPQRQMHLKMGAQVGELIADAHDVYGHDVNLAARLTALAGPGEVVISADVRPGGHFKFPHLWPGQTPPGGTTGMDGLLLGLVSLCKAVGGFFEPVAFAAEFDEDTAVQEAVQNGGGQRGVAKEFVPIFHDPV